LEPIRSWDISVGISTGYGLDDRDSIPGKGKKFSLLYNVQAGFRVPSSSYPMHTGGSFPGV
jgi:hypothetical protein